MSDKLIIKKQKHLLLMGINRPEKKNAFDVEILEALSGAFTELSDDHELRCGIVYAEGDCFCVGLDLADVMPRIVQNGASPITQKELPDPCDPYRLMGRECSKPVITAVHGLCYTAGLELVLASDLCIAATNTIFRQMEVTRGVFPMGGATFRLPALIGWHNAMKYMLTGDSFTADEAKRFGLVQEIEKPGQQLEKAMAYGEKISKNAPLAVQAVIKISRMVTNTPQEIINAGRSEVLEISKSKDVQEGILSLMEKREPKFMGE